MTDEMKFIDAESYQGGQEEKLTFREIVLQHLRKIGTQSAVEFRGGYWMSKPSPQMNSNASIEEYIPDSREVFSNSVMYLFNLLYPHFDKDMKEAGDKLELELDQSYKETTISLRKDAEAETKKEADKLNEGTTKKTEYRKFPEQEHRLAFRSVRLTICWKILRELSCFLKRQDYFKGKTFEEEI